MQALIFLVLTVKSCSGEKPYTCQWPECNNQFARWDTFTSLVISTFPQVWRANTPLSEAHGCKAVQMQSMWAQFCSQRPSCLAHEKTPTKAHEELSVRGEKSKKVNTTVKKFKCDTKCDDQGWGCRRQDAFSPRGCDATRIKANLQLVSLEICSFSSQGFQHVQYRFWIRITVT